MTRPPRLPPSLLRHPFLGSAAVSTGLLTYAQLRGSSWVRIFRDVYVHAGVEITPLIRAAAASLLLPAGGAISGRVGAWLHGVDLLGMAGDDPVELVVPPGTHLRPRPGLVIRTATVDACDVLTVRGLPVLRPLRLAFDLSRAEPDLVEAVACVDALARIRGRQRFRPAALLDYAAGRPRARGNARLPEIVDLSDPLAESPMETRLRLLLVQGGLPRPVSQFAIHTEDGLFLARVDLAYPGTNLAIEYDGENHDQRWMKDIARQNEIFREGWILRRYTKRMVYQTPDLILREIKDLLMPVDHAGTAVKPRP